MIFSINRPFKNIYKRLFFIKHSSTSLLQTAISLEKHLDGCYAWLRTCTRLKLIPAQYVCSYFALPVNTFYTCIAKQCCVLHVVMNRLALNTFILMVVSFSMHIGCKHYLKTMFFFNGNVSNTHFDKLNSFEMLKDLIAVFLFSDTPLNQLEAGH